MKNGNAKTNTSKERAAKRKRLYRARMRNHGLILMQFWVHPDDRKKVKRNVKKLLEARLKLQDMSHAID